MSFELTILGSSSATPIYDRFPSAQHLNMFDRHILIDCGEGTQMQMRRFKLKKTRLHYIFISHVHADHILGLPGLIFSLNLQNRTEPLHVFGPQSLFEILDLFLKHSETVLKFELVKHITQNKVKELLLEDSLIKVYSFPLYHRVPTTGFLFEENNRLKKLNVEACRRHHIPFTFYNDIKLGKDFISPDTHIIIPNEDLTFSNYVPVKYAYCSDTRFDERVAKEAEGVDLMYHESTFLHDKLPRAIETMHSTALEAGITARLAGVKKLLIGHFSSRYDDLRVLLQEAKLEFENTELAIEGRKFGIGETNL
jgi:ribonuclease Z